MILCVDPDADARSAICDAVSAAGLRAHGVESAAAASEHLDDPGLESVVTEYDLPDGSGLKLIRETRERAPDAACVLYTDVPRDHRPGYRRDSRGGPRPGPPAAGRPAR